MVYGRDVKEIDGNKVDVYEVHVPYDQPLIAGWELVWFWITLEGNIVRPTCEEILPDHYRNNSFCEHCGINRRRNTTYVLKKDGEFKASRLYFVWKISMAIRVQPMSLPMLNLFLRCVKCVRIIAISISSILFSCLIFLPHAFM